MRNQPLDNKARVFGQGAWLDSDQPIHLYFLVMLNICVRFSLSPRMLLLGLTTPRSRSLVSLRPCCRERAGDDRVACTNATPHEPQWL
jgi:hypothetical protein